MKGGDVKEMNRKNFLVKGKLCRWLFCGFLLTTQGYASDFDFGSIAGEFSVNGGSASYTIPIQVPAGVAGMQPELTLSYSSHGGGGYLGQGWSLQGLTAINRCPKTEAQDGAKDNVSLDENDRYCIGGQRLIAVSGPYGAAGTKYRTEIDSFSRITSVGGTPELGPDSWIVETKAGQTIELGGTYNSRLLTPTSVIAIVLKRGNIKVSWQVNKITDAVGNTITFDYYNYRDSGEIYPKTILYGGNDIGTANSVRFSYEQRPDGDRLTGYIAGVKSSIFKRLTEIATYRQTRKVRSYKPTYEIAHTTWQSRIISLEECAGDGTCLPETHFDYEDWSPTSLPYDNTSILVEDNFTYNDNTWRVNEHLRMLADVDGDGVADIVGFGDHGVDVKLASGEGFTRLPDFGRMTNSGNKDWVIGRHLRMMADINADGKADIVGFGDHGVYYSLSRGTSFAPKVEWVMNEFGYADDANGWKVDQHPRMLADVDGDTKPDIVGFGENLVVVKRASGLNFDPFPGFGDSNWNIERNPRYVADVDGDGRADIVGFANHGVVVAFSEGDHFREPVTLVNGFVQEDPEEVSARNRTWRSRELADVNGDGMVDIVGFAKDGVYVSLSTGRGFLDPVRWIHKFGINTGEAYVTYKVRNPDYDFESETIPQYLTVNGWDIDKHIITLADMNGDGRMDIVGFADDGVYASASLGEAPQQDRGFSVPVKLHNEFYSKPQLSLVDQGYDSDKHLRMLGDVNGDGLADIIGFHDDEVIVAYNRLPHIGDITRITSGSGVEIGIEYQSIAGANEYYTKGTGADAAQGELDVQIPIRVVTSVNGSNGLIGGVNSLSYRYGGMRINKNGRGPLGFSWTVVEDNQTGIVTRTELEQSFPHTGSVLRATTTLPNGNVTSLAESRLSQHQTDTPGVVYQPYILETTTTEYELNGDQVKQVHVENQGYDAYGNLLESTITTTGEGETFFTHTKNDYDNDPDNWILGRLRRSEVTRSQGQGTTQTHSTTRTSAFEYDPATGLLTKEIIEPGDPTLSQTTEYSYDRFGNKIISVTSGAGLAQPRISRTQYDSYGRFPAYSVNALGHYEYYNYDYICGKLTRLRGPNNGITTWTYDAFCRQTSETRPNGTKTTTERYRVLDATQHESVPAGWPADTERYSLANVHYKYVTKETAKAPVTVYYDQLGREIRAETVGMNNKVIYQDTVYNALGQVERASRRYFAGEAIHWVRSSYDILGRTTLLDAPADYGVRALTKTIYDGLRTTTVDAKGRSITITKDALDRVVRTDQPEGAFVINRYDAYDNLIETEDAKGNVVAMAYDDRGRKISMDDPDMGHWEYRYNTLGELIWQKDAAGHIVTMEYDVLGRMVLRSEAEGDTTWDYDGNYGKGKLISVTAPGGYSEKLTYDRHSRPYIVDTTINGNTYSVKTLYDPVTGLVSRVYRPDGFVVDNVYDDNGYLISKRTPIQQVSDYESGHLRGLMGVALDSAKEALARAETYAADAADFEAWAETLQSEVVQEVETQILSKPVAGLQYHKPYHVYTHSTTGELFLESPDQIMILRRKVNTPIRVSPRTHYRVITEADGSRSLEAVDAQTWNSSIKPYLVASENHVFFGDYNADGETDYLVRNQNNDALYTSEQLQRLAEAASEIEAVAEIFWDRAADAVSAATQLIAIAGRVDDAMRQAELWAQNLDGEDIQDMVVNGGNVVYWQANSRDAEHRLTGFRQGNGLVTLRDYDPASGHLMSIQSGFEFGSNIRKLEYEYDVMDNVTSRRDRVQGMNEEFQYDNLDRLTKNTVYGKLSGLDYQYDTQYEYDLTGNILYKSDVGQYTYGSARRTVGNAGPAALINAGPGHTNYRYDSNGNLLSGGGRVFQWTSFNKPRRMRFGNDWAEFDYGPDRARYRKRNSAGETTYYIGKIYERIEKDGVITHKHFIHTDDGVAAIQIRTENNGTRTNKTRYLLTDALGSVDTITDGLGVIADRMSFDAFGMRRAGGWHHDLPIEISALTNRGFTGHEHVDEIGIIHMNGRIYDPELGRFLSADPHVQSPLNSQSHNRYSYVLNNPLKYTDPSGYFFKALKKFMKRYGMAIVAIGLSIVTAGAAVCMLGYATVFTTAAAAGGMMAGMAAVAATGAMGVLAVAAAGAVGGFVAGYITTGTKQGAFKGAAIGFFSSLFATAIGQAAHAGQISEGAANLAHGISQGTISAASGGDFKSGFIGAFIGHAVGAKIKAHFGGNVFSRTMAAAVSGGIASALGGGKFANGALSAAFAHLFNNEAISAKQEALDKYNALHRELRQRAIDNPTGELDLSLDEMKVITDWIRYRTHEQYRYDILDPMFRNQFNGTDTFLHNSPLLTGRQFNVGGISVAEGGHINYLAVGMLAAHYGPNVEQSIPLLVVLHNAQQIYNNEGWRNLQDIGPGTKWALFGASQYR